jgi:hypothetical protein
LPDSSLFDARGVSRARVLIFEIEARLWRCLATLNSYDENDQSELCSFGRGFGAGSGLGLRLRMRCF